MKLWISKSSVVPIPEQLVTQLVLGIVSGDLSAGECLPSTSEIARRFGIHANTVRAAYRALAERGWVEWRAGSGFYVRPKEGEKAFDPRLDLDHLISTFVDVARSRGHGLAEIQSRMERWFGLQKPDHIVVIEPEPELREILIAEITEKLPMRVTGTDLDRCRDASGLTRGFCVTLYDHAEEIRAVLPAEIPCLFLRSRSVPASLAGESKPSQDTLITITSRWPSFLRWAQTTLVAVGIDPAALDLRDARQEGWQRGLNGRSFIITDTLLARALPKGCRPRVFPLIADQSMIELQRRVQ